MRKFGWIVLALAPLVAAGGCSRTSDGSVELAEPYLAPTPVPGVRVLTFRRQRIEPPPAETRFPPPPEAGPPTTELSPPPVRRLPPRKRPSIETSAAAPSAPVTCRNVTNAQGRVRVVCD